MIVKYFEKWSQFALERDFCLSCGVSDVFAPQACSLKKPNCGANRPFWCQCSWHWDPQIGADMQAKAAKRIAALWLDFKMWLGLCHFVPNGPSKSIDVWLACMLQTIIYLLILQSFQSLSIFQSLICFCNDCQCERAFKSLGLSCNHLALMKEERDQRNSSGFETEKKHSALTSPSRLVSNDSFALVVKSELQSLNQNSRFKPSGDERKVWIRHAHFTVCGLIWKENYRQKEKI